MRLLDFFDGAQSETAPTIGNLLASGLITYPDDATYEATEQGAPIEGNIYFNETSKLIRYYNGTDWIDLVDDESVQTILNKTLQNCAIDADQNVITNIDNDDIKAGAAIDATKIHDGSVDNTEFGYLDGVSSPIQTQLDAKQDTSEKDQPNGYAGLDGSGKISAAVVPDDFVQFKGTWDANTNTPTLADGVGNIGDVYRTSVAGTQDLGSGSQDFKVGDWVTYNGSIWERSDYIGGAAVLNDLSDVNISTPANNDVLSYNSGTTDWENREIVEADGSIDTHSDVDVTSTPPNDGDVLTYNNGTSNWEPAAPAAGASEGRLISKQIFTTSGTWNKPVGINTVLVEVIGAGGGGGSGDSTAAGQMSCASGGGAGGYARKLIDVSAISSETITIGAGGGGSAGNNGTAGGTSSFGAHCSATGGSGGIGSTSSTGGRIANGVSGGTGVSGDINATGGGSDSATSDGDTAVGTAGGNSNFGGGGSGRAAVLGSPSISGLDGGNYGAGGSGTCNGQSTTTTAGGSGSDGIIIVWEYS